ncbi:hypothetical protein ACO0LF_16285 [Undibacterium sp. Di27W]|uniref:hypothetical protein n=1 Tax=Undibacterium sp. Di27W TaxID=3413036 RepID=UPI003BEFCDE6
MKPLYISLLCSLALLALSPAQAQQAHPATPVATHPRPEQQSMIQAELARLIEQFGDGIAETYSGKPARILYGQLFEEHKNDAVVLFSMEGFGGGNLHAEFVAFFAEQHQYDAAIRKARPYRLVAVSKLAQRGWRTFDFDSARIRQGMLTIDGMQMGPKDANCCPSVAISRSLRIDEFDHIIETMAIAAKPSKPAK